MDPAEIQPAEAAVDDPIHTGHLAADQPEPDIPEPPVTGDGLVDDAVAQLAAVMGQPLEAQVQAFDAVHRALQDRLADVEG